MMTGCRLLPVEDCGTPARHETPLLGINARRSREVSRKPMGYHERVSGRLPVPTITAITVQCCRVGTLMQQRPQVRPATCRCTLLRMLAIAAALHTYSI